MKWREPRSCRARMWSSHHRRSYSPPRANLVHSYPPVPTHLHAELHCTRTLHLHKSSSQKERRRKGDTMSWPISIHSDSFPLLQWG
ncbi:hypothetical protein SCLCIDRAFT_1225083, partial [Scleroderma citrinum Foug A]